MAIKIATSVVTTPPPVEDLDSPPWEEHLPVASKQGDGSVAVVVEKNKKVISHSEEVFVVPAPPAIPKSRMGNLTVGGGMTISMGPGTFEFAKISVFLTVPCDLDEKDEVYEKVTDWVSTKVQQAVLSVKGQPPSVEHL